MQIKNNYKIANYTWFKLGGLVQKFFIPESISDIKDFIKTVSPCTPIYPLGFGSNILIRDGGVNGVLIKLGQGFGYINLTDEILRVGAAATDRSVSIFAKNNGIGGFEFLYNIPGSIGGGIKMNCGCYGSEIKDNLKEIKIFDLKSNKIITRKKEEIDFKYRETNINDNQLIIEASFYTEKKDKDKIWGKMQANEKMRKQNQPTSGRMAGSVFKNPNGISAWQVINKIGGDSISNKGACVSKKHNNFILAKNDGTANDVEDLINTIKKKAKEQYNIDMQLEIKIIGAKERK